MGAQSTIISRPIHNLARCTRTSPQLPALTVRRVPVRPEGPFQGGVSPVGKGHSDSRPLTQIARSDVAERYASLLGTAPEPAHSPKCSQNPLHFPSFSPVSRSKQPPTSLLGTEANPCTRVLHQTWPRAPIPHKGGRACPPIQGMAQRIPDSQT